MNIKVEQDLGWLEAEVWVSCTVNKEGRNDREWDE